jgi:ribonuclease P protein component
MIARRHRFHGYGSVKAVYRRSQGARGPLLGLRYARRSPGQAYRVAVVVSRKVNKSAVKRNRIRRRIYEVIRAYEDMLPKETDLVFTVFSDQIIELEQIKLETAIEELIKKTS